MKLDHLTTLRHGAAIYGLATDPELEKLPMSNEAVVKIVYVFVSRLQEKLERNDVKIVVGRDNRIASPHMAQAACVGTLSKGLDVTVAPLATTYSVHMACIDPEINADGGVMITAEDQPFDINGVKLFTKDGLLGEEEIISILEEAAVIETEIIFGGQRKDIELIPKYADGLVQKVRAITGKEMPLDGKTIVIDAANGVAGFFHRFVLQALGADTSGSINLQPDGHFPNHLPSVADPEAVAAIQAAVKMAEADLGILFNGDASRTIVFDGQGTPIVGEELQQQIIKVILRNTPGCTVVTDETICDETKDLVESLGGTVKTLAGTSQEILEAAKALVAEGTAVAMVFLEDGDVRFADHHWQADGCYTAAVALAAFACEL